MVFEAEKPPKAPRKSGRSTSPRAVELRRLQNRISQRNHRRRVREGIQSISRAPQETSIDSTTAEARHESNRVDQNRYLYDQNRQTHPQALPQDVSINTSLGQPIGYTDTHLASPTPDSPSSLLLAGMMISNSYSTDDSLNQLDIWANLDPLLRTPPETEMRLSQPYSPPTCSCNGATGPCPGHLERMRLQVLADMSSPAQHHQTHQSNPSRSSDSGPQLPHIGHLRGSTRLFSAVPHSSGTSTSTGGILSPPSDFFPHGASATPAADITRRFGIVLEAMRTAGFTDFDGMATAYYTAEFEKGSFPAMAQCASRSRRLKGVVRRLQENSGQWPRWESRGLHEAISEATASVCTAEMEHANEAKTLHPQTNDLANLITSFECLLWDHGYNVPADHMGYSSAPENLQTSGEVDAAPDSMPYLWHMLTELAGSQGMYCDRIAKVVLSILLYARGTQ